ncbi:Multidrug resistance ABC transporter ATP-binding and permease protein [Granulibacter bethesdensis]|nr:Multidrug resistance ABC transporter ATP-binding and permease protein [Granulibacter bethesdensis]
MRIVGDGSINITYPGLLMSSKPVTITLSAHSGQTIPGCAQWLQKDWVVQQMAGS